MWIIITAPCSPIPPSSISSGWRSIMTACCCAFLRLSNPDELGEMTRQDKMFDIFKEHHRWQEILGIRTVGDFNQAIDAGHATDIINISEALQEKKLAKIAEEIASRKGSEAGAAGRSFVFGQDYFLQASEHSACRKRTEAVCRFRSMIIS